MGDFIIREDWIKEVQMPTGTWTRRQLELMGIKDWPPRSGWRSMAAGRKISRADKEEVERISKAAHDHEASFGDLFEGLS